MTTATLTIQQATTNAAALHNLRKLVEGFSDAMSAWQTATLAANATTTDRGFTPEQERQAAEQMVDAERFYILALKEYGEARRAYPAAALELDSEYADWGEPEPKRSDYQWI